MIRKLLPFMLLLGCASSQKTISGSADRSRLFPLGAYQHRVELNIHGKEEKKFKFDGLVKIEPEFIRVVVLSPMGLTLFRITDALKTGDVKIEIYVDSLKKHQPKVREYYSALKYLLQLPAKTERAEVNSATIKIIGYDSHEIPEQVQIQHPTFLVDIEVVGYDI